MEDGDTTARAMVAEITLAEAISTIANNPFFTEQAIPTLAMLVSQISDGAKAEKKLRADNLTQTIADNLKRSNPDLAQAVREAASCWPMRPSDKIIPIPVVEHRKG